MVCGTLPSCHMALTGWAPMGHSFSHCSPALRKIMSFYVSALSKAPNTSLPGHHKYPFLVPVKIGRLVCSWVDKPQCFGAKPVVCGDQSQGLLDNEGREGVLDGRADMEPFPTPLSISGRCPHLSPSGSGYGVTAESGGMKAPEAKVRTFLIRMALSLPRTLLQRRSQWPELPGGCLQAEGRKR